MLFNIHQIAIQCSLFLFRFNEFDDLLNIRTQFLFLQVFLNLESFTLVDHSRCHTFNFSSFLDGVDRGSIAWSCCVLQKGDNIVFDCLYFLNYRIKLLRVGHITNTDNRPEFFVFILNKNNVFFSVG